MSTLPTTPGYSAIALKSNQSIIVDTSESGKRQARLTGGHLWEIKVTYPTMTRAQFSPIDGFIMALDGELTPFDIVYPLSNIGTWDGDDGAACDGAFAAGVTTIDLNGMTTGSMVLDGTEVGAWLADTTAETVTAPATDNDLSSNDHDLAYFGTITKSPVATGSEVMAYSGFSASNYLQQTYDAALDLTTAVTMCAWVKITTTLSGDSQTIGGNFESLSGDNGGFMFHASTDEIMRFWCRSNAGTNYSAQDTSVLPLNEWIFYVGTKDASGNLLLYKNGALMASTTGVFMGETNTPVVVGAYTTAIAAPLDKGETSLVRVLPSALTATQILNIYNSEKRLFIDNDDVSGTSVKAGDIFKAANHTKVYKITEDATPDAAGNITINFKPALIESLNDNEILTVADVPFRVAVKGMHEFKISAPQLYRYDLDLVESI